MREAGGVGGGVTVVGMYCMREEATFSKFCFFNQCGHLICFKCHTFFTNIK